MKFHCIVSNGKINFTGSRPWVRMRISELPDGEYDLEIRKHFKKRSLSQNAYYWGVVVQLVFEGLREAGFDDVVDQEDAHEVLKSMFFKKVIHSEKHDNLEQIVSTTKFSTAEFNERIEAITRWAFEYLGITIPPPNSQAALEFNESKPPYLT